jgi:hypothetical protein
MLFRLSGGGDKQRQEAVRQSVWDTVRGAGLTAENVMTSAGTQPPVIDFLRSFDLSYRIRRLRSVARRLAQISEAQAATPASVEQARALVYDLIGRYRSLRDTSPVADVEERPAQAMQSLADRLDLKSADDEADRLFAEALSGLPKPERRALILAYLGFPFYDIATLPLLQGEGLDEFDPVKVDRISPDDATAMRSGGAAATLKGIQFNSFGAFFSRAYRENDYLWGRLHGADRLIDILVSTLPEGTNLPEARIADLKREAFRAILTEERPRLTQIGSLFEELEREIG